MNINELDELTKEWNRFDADNEYLQSIRELIAAYRGAIAALETVQVMCDPPIWVSDDVIDPVLATAKRLGAIP